MNFRPILILCLLSFFQVSCFSGLFEDDFNSSRLGSSREAKPQIIENEDGTATCAIDGTPIVTTTAYRIASLKPLKRDSQFAQLTRKYPNYLPPEWSLTRSNLYRYPGPVQYCPTCQAGMQRELKVAFDEGAQDEVPQGAGSNPGARIPIAGMGGSMTNF